VSALSSEEAGEEELQEEEEEEEGEAEPVDEEDNKPLFKRPASALGVMSMQTVATAKKEAGVSGFGGNSGTHAAEYKEFLRKVKVAAKGKTFPIACSDEFTTNKADMFKVFMDNGKNIEATLDLIVRRTITKKKLAEEKFVWKKKRDFCGNYGETIDKFNPKDAKTPKTDKVCARLAKDIVQHLGVLHLLATRNTMLEFTFTSAKLHTISFT
jgi:hypothetical protein